MSRAALVNLGDGFAGHIAHGSGEPVPWIHGYTLDSSSWLPLWSLLPDWQHIGVDLPGHGSSVPLGPSESLPSLARRIAAIAFRHRVRHCVALSFGTRVAIQLAIEYPEAFDTIVLGAPALGGGPEEPDVAARYNELTAMYQRRGFHP